MKQLAGVACAALVLFGLAARVWAAPIPIVNADFETTPKPGADSDVAGLMTNGAVGWTNVNGSYYRIDFASPQWYTNPQIVNTNGTGGQIGTMLGPVVAYTWQTTGSGLRQTLAATVQANTLYTLTVAVGSRNGSFGDVYGGWGIQLYGGASLLAQASQATDPIPVGLGSFADADLTYFAGPADPYLGLPLEIRLIQLTGGTGNYADFDNVRLDATSIPEPTTLALAAAGLAALRRRRTPGATARAARRTAGGRGCWIRRAQ